VCGVAQRAQLGAFRLVFTFLYFRCSLDAFLVVSSLCLRAAVYGVIKNNNNNNNKIIIIRTDRLAMPGSDSAVSSFITQSPPSSSVPAMPGPEQLQGTQGSSDDCSTPDGR